jgi:hypothetical protein
MFLIDPRSALINWPIPLLDHLVFKLLSSTFEGTLPSLPLAVTALMIRLVPHEGGGDDPEPNTSSSVIDAQLFAVLPFTVILTYLASVAGMVYF